MSSDQHGEGASPVLVGTARFRGTTGQPLGAEDPALLARWRATSPPPPAEHWDGDLVSLLSYLEREDDGHFLYRGQVQRYPALVPSVYRRAIVPGAEADPVIAVDARRYHDAADTDHEKLAALSAAMASYGPTVGNIVAQQYGLDSEALDVTSDPRTAAFFASRRYPTYEPVEPGGEPGVIFRFPVDDRPPVDPSDPPESYGQAVKNVDPWGPVTFTLFRARWDLDEAMLTAAREMWQPTGGGVVAEVMTRPMVRDSRFYVDHLAATFGAARDLAATRFGRQAGGSIRTVSRWKAAIPARPDVVTFPGTGSLAFVPPLAIGLELMAIENVDRYPGLRIFTFDHGRPAPLPTREALWPERRSDWLWNDLAERIGDPYSRLIDPGYR